MGNQIVCPSDMGWYQDDLTKLDIQVENSIYDGTFMLSFKAFNTKLNKDIAVKAFLIPEDDNGIRDQQVLSVIESSKQIFDKLIRQEYKLKGCLVGNYHLADRQVYLVRPYITHSLQSRMNDYPELTNIEKDWIAYQIIRAVQNIHSNGYIHGDIKPENILLTDRLQVLITDFSPYKPKYLRRSQPNYFLHYFNYNGSSSYIAPERVVESLPQTPVSLQCADIFSLGCVLAFLYTGGSTIFNFTTIQDYANGDLTPLQALDRVKDENKRNYIKELIQLDPNYRLQAFGQVDSYYPPWFSKFYDAFYSNSVDTVFMEKLLQIHDQLVDIIPQDDPESALIYFNILSDVILSSGRAFSLLTLLNHYVNLTTTYFDTPMKLTRAIPPLFEIFERKITIAGLFAFNAINSILESIDSIPHEFSNYHTAFLIPRLSSVLKISWASSFLCNLSSWAISMQRLWPTFYEDLRRDVSICEYLFMVNSSIIQSNGSNESDVGFIRAFLKECLRSAEQCADFQLFSTLSFFFLPLLTTAIFFSDIVDVIYAFYCNFDANSKLRFYDNLQDPLFNAIFSHEPDENNTVVLFTAYLKILKMEPQPFYVSTIATHSLAWVNHPNPAISIAAKIVSDNLPIMFRKLNTANLIVPLGPLKMSNNAAPVKSHSKLNARSMTLNQISQIQTRKIHSKSQWVNGNKSITARERSDAAYRQDSKSLFIASKKLDVMKITDVFFSNENNILAKVGDSLLVSVEVSKGKINILQNFQHFCPISTIARVHDNSYVYADAENIYSYDCDRMKLIKKTSNQINGMIALNSDQMALFYKDSNSVEFFDIKSESLIRKMTCSESCVSSVATFEDIPFIFTTDLLGNVNVFDTRVELPVMHKQINGAYNIIPLCKDTLKFAVVGNEIVSVSSMESDNSLVDIIGSHGAVCNDGQAIVICSSTGTYYVSSEDPNSSYSLFEGEQPVKLNYSDLTNYITLPKTLNRSLHNHSFLVESVVSRDNVVCSGDINGIMNIWSPNFTLD
ncbi:CMGC family protein kinase [Trichomonas vaginalis G3]|uniref:CMGC family protein kinase n=1 Tax=Trichomonas vaginalis (strain ATCC PRA-98 / G3) TaxID=412133 RepID=A2F2P1_TRIV3|nr:autophagy of peroxisome [Trichomonas vaginalis G3]EAY00815.1 CMGC family protein kinase [Trichomonas vaginalis G3]KAI5492105.1 autophagy of peroxisome [Trichomonas vaginalis G3]|eukprot:XP_001313744.1 CMGC family protein kinase [Trichomonas vaginalis G3]